MPHTVFKEVTLIKSGAGSCHGCQMLLMGSYGSYRSHHMYCSSTRAFPLTICRTTFTACMLGTLLILCSWKPAMANVHPPARGMALHGQAQEHARRVSISDLNSRHVLERTIQLAAFQQFDGQKTGRLYNVSVPTLSSGTFQAIRLRSGSFRRYGVDISEFTIPRGCVVSPIPERVLLVYSRLLNTSLFQDVPGGLILASPVVSVLVYDASNLNSSAPPQQLSVSATESLISIHIAPSLNSKCVYFDDQSINVNITDPVEGACQTDHLGSFALATSATAPAPSPAIAQSPPSARKTHSSTWKIVLGSVIGGLALLVLVSFLAWGIGKRRKMARIQRMEYQADQGETLQMTTVRTSRVPMAADTRTQPMLENEYTV